jgi:ATP-dependent exoDNAse (exonuclease V) beta subunit
VLRSLLDEAVQDPAGGRGLLYVGDVTQGIFGWRGGAPTLSREIFERDKGTGGAGDRGATARRIVLGGAGGAGDGESGLW